MVIAQEIVHTIRNHKGKNGLMAMKIDLRKAYDKMEWRFVDQALEGWGLFGEAFVGHGKLFAKELASK